MVNQKEIREQLEGDQSPLEKRKVNKNTILLLIYCHDGNVFRIYSVSSSSVPEGLHSIHTSWHCMTYRRNERNAMSSLDVDT